MNGPGRAGAAPRAQAGLHVLVVDGDDEARAALAQMLAARAAVGTVEAVSTGTAAMVLAAQEVPDAVFLEARLPDIDGLLLASSLRRLAPPPEIVFVAADSDAAVAAFALAATHYLLKPVTADRVGVAVKRLTPPPDDARRRRASSLAAGQERMIAVEGSTGGASRLMPLSSLIAARAQNDHVELTCDDGAYRLRATLSMLEARWQDSGFERVHRSFLVNVHRIRELQPSPGGAVLVMADGSTIPVARRQLSRLKRRVGIGDAA